MDDGASLALHAGHTLPQAGMDALLSKLRDAGGERFDAAGWHYLETLARRSAAHEGSVRRMLEAKLERAVAAFAERFDHARSAAAQFLSSSCEKHPHAAAELQRLFTDSDFKGLRRLRAALDASAQCAAFGELVAQLEPTLARGRDLQSASQAASRITAPVAPPLELKTVRESRDTWARLSVDKQLALAMKQAPQNAGPINSHMLVLRSLAMMQAISPDYLSSVVSYVDTLLALDPGEAAVLVKKKKAVTAKASKPTKAIKKT
jgi:hypothetical protein